MRSRMHSARWIAALLATALVLAGCGVPDAGAPQRHGKEEPAGALKTSGSGVDDTVDPYNVGDPAQVIEDRFYKAGGPADPRRENQVKQFFTDDSRNRWQSTTQDVSIVDIDVQQIGNTGDQATVVARGTQIGKLSPRGTITPDPQPYEIQFELMTVEVPGHGRTWLISKASKPPGYVLSTNALKERFEPRSVYFTANGASSLVPELRWVPKAVEGDQRLDLLARWVLAGPSTWLAEPAIVGQVVPTMEPRGRVVRENGKIVVDLPAAAEGKDLEKLAAQLSWTFRTDSTAEGIEIRVEGNPKQTRSRETFLRSNPAAVPLRDSSGYIVVNEQLVPVDEKSTGAPAVFETVRTDGLRVRRAGLTRALDRVAVVRVDPTGPETVSVLTRVGDDTPKDDVQRLHTALRAGHIGRPTWLDNARFLALVDGKLLRFKIEGNQLTHVQVKLPPTLGTVTAIAAAPDGRRVAVVADGRARVVLLAENASGPVITDKPQQLGYGFDQVTGVAWSGENRLVLGGRRSDNGVPLMELMIDSVETPARTYSGGIPQSVASYMVDPKDRPGVNATVLTRVGEFICVVQSATSDCRTRGAAPFYPD